MDKITFLKSHVSNLEKILDHSDKLMEPHKNLVTITQRVVEAYANLSAKEQKSLGLVYRKSMLAIVNRSLAKIERMEEHNVQMKARSNNLKNIDMESFFLQK